MKKKWIRQVVILLLISSLVFEPIPVSILRIGPVLYAAAEEKVEDSESGENAEEDTEEETGKKAEKEESEKKAEEEIGKKAEEEAAGKKTEEALTNVSDELVKEAASESTDDEFSADGKAAPAVERRPAMLPQRQQPQQIRRQQP